MLRRPPTSIHLSADDLAIFEKQYAQGQIYADHQPNSSYSGQPQYSGGTPDSSRREGQMAGKAGAQVGGEERRVKTRLERIHGTGGAAAAAAVAVVNAAVTGNTGGSAGAAQQGR